MRNYDRAIASIAMRNYAVNKFTRIRYGSAQITLVIIDHNSRDSNDCSSRKITVTTLTRL